MSQKKKVQQDMGDAADFPGEPADFDAVAARYALPLARYIQGRTGRPDLAEDLAQETLLRAFRAAERGLFDGRSSEKTWLFTIATNCVRDHWRSSRRKARRIGGDEAARRMALFSSAEPGPEQSAVQAEDVSAALAALDDLPDEQRQVLALKFFGELTFAQIAEVTDTPLNTVKSRARYALGRLRDSLLPKTESQT